MLTPHTTVGHAGNPDLTRYRTGSMPQIHFYPFSHKTNAFLPSYLSGDPPVLGEIATNKPDSVASANAALRAWPELYGSDESGQYECVLRRLWRANDKGYDLCLLWPDIDKAREPTTRAPAKYHPDVWKAIADFYADKRI